jgi:hypothetical protein
MTAERQAARHDRLRVGAVNQWRKAEYWHERTRGVISHALHKSSAPVRRGRIKELEAHQRKFLADVEKCQQRYDDWKKLLTMDGIDEVIPLDDGGFSIVNPNPAQQFAYLLCSDGRDHASLWHPTNEAVNAKAREIWGHGLGTYDLLCKDSFASVPMERLTPRQVAELYLSRIKNPAEQESFIRWREHYEMRLTYERAMLENEGGSAANVEMVPGGFVNIRGEWYQIQKVNRSTATGRVVSVQVWGTSTGYTRESNYTKQETRPRLVNVNIERKGEAIYREPTPEELAEFNAAKIAKAKANPTPPLINPTPADAARLQKILNDRAAEQAREKGKKPPSIAEVVETTQANYSRYSGESSIYHTCVITVGENRFKCRMKHRGFYEHWTADSVVVLTDKPQKPLPLDQTPTAANPEPTAPAAPTPSAITTGASGPRGRLFELSEITG